MSESKEMKEKQPSGPEWLTKEDMLAGILWGMVVLVVFVLVCEAFILETELRIAAMVAE